MPRHIVVDGSNLATEGRSMPSLRQLNDAVNAFIAENPTDVITVVVDATFGHRIDASEVPEFEAAIEHNELVAPPAGAVGRGDAFVLSIANKVKATILTNDSYQEFHPDFPWLFDEGRLIGGKPVPNVGWVFVARIPVRGPVSRRATREKKAKDSGPTRAPKASKAANQPMPVPTAPPPGAVLPAAEKTGRRRRGSGASSTDAAPAAAAAAAPTAAVAAVPAAAGSGAHVNSLMPFLTFVEKHPVGTSVNAIVESYSSHGAYVTIGDVRGYVPLRLMADPPPRSAREAMKIGESVTLVVASFSPARRSIDLSVPHLAAIAVAGDDVSSSDDAATTKAPRRKKATAAAKVETEASETPPPKRAAATKATPARKTTARTKPSTQDSVPAGDTVPANDTTPAPKAAATKGPAKKAAPAKKAPAEKAAPAKKAPARGAAPAKKAAAKKAAPADEPAPVQKKAGTKKAAAAEKAAPTTKPAPKKAAAAKATAPVKKAAPAKKAAAKKATS